MSRCCRNKTSNIQTLGQGSVTEEKPVTQTMFTLLLLWILRALQFQKHMFLFHRGESQHIRLNMGLTDCIIFFFLKKFNQNKRDHQPMWYLFLLDHTATLWTSLTNGGGENHFQSTLLSSVDWPFAVSKKKSLSFFCVFLEFLLFGPYGRMVQMRRESCK